MNPELFSSIIYSSVYTLFVFIPLIIKTFLSNVSLFKRLTPYLPQDVSVLIILFGSSFQVYFYDDFGAQSDMATLLAGTALFAIYLVKNFSILHVNTKLHFLFVISAIGINMYAYKNIRFLQHAV